jgi:hypothetical protein
MPSLKSAVKFFPQTLVHKVGTTFVSFWNMPTHNFNTLCQAKTKNRTPTVEDELKLSAVINTAWRILKFKGRETDETGGMKRPGEQGSFPPKSRE